jgi:hypothetical protein
MNNLEERKITLLSQIDRLKGEINRLKWLEYREVALCSCTGSVRYIVPDRPRENLVN